MSKPLHDQIVVITGASSGIGRQTAIDFAQHGALVVLAARNEMALQETAAEVIRRGGQAHVVVTDVAQWDQTQNLAREAIARFGRIDTWVNNASVAEYASIEQTTIEEFARIMDVNYMGVVHGTKAALPWMIEQGGGTIINVGSILSEVYVPFLGAYTAAKHAVKGFTDTLRLELAHDRSSINVVLIMPATINTPFFNHARSKLGVLPRPFPPAYPPDIVARSIVYAAQHPQREIIVGGAGRMLITLEKISRTAFDGVLLFGGFGFDAQRSVRTDDGLDNLDDPGFELGRVTGDFDNVTLPSSVYTDALELHPLLARLVALVFIGGTVALLTLPSRRRRANLDVQSVTHRGQKFLDEVINSEVVRRTSRTANH